MWMPLKMSLLLILFFVYLFVYFQSITSAETYQSRLFCGMMYSIMYIMYLLCSYLLSIIL